MSVRGERVIYREREREEDRQPERRSYTTVKRYQVPERSFEEDVVQTDKIMVKRERREEPARTEVSYRASDRDARSHYTHRDEGDWNVTERVTERELPQRRDISYRVIERDNDRHSHHDTRSDFRFVEREREREVIRAPSPPPVEERVREYRFERERSYSPPPRREREREPEIERYVRSAEYYQQPQPIIIREPAPQPIIIERERREPQPIIIRREEPQYEVVEREEVREEHQSLVRREDPPAPATVVSKAPSKALTVVNNQPTDENYFYERRIREIERAPRDDIQPKDSASQYSSDDSYEYVRRERVVEGSRDRSGHRKRDLAAGALAGVAGAEILRSHRKKDGQEVGGRGRSLVGGAAVGALGAEAFRRAKSLRRGSRSRSRGSSYESRRPHRRRSKSRDRSKSVVRKYGGVAAVAAAGALAGYALMKNKGNKSETIIVKEGDRRSRSRRRAHSVDTGYLSDSSYRSQGRSRSRSARNPAHRNKRIAQAGLASATAAGLWSRARSKSRGGKSRSRSRIKTGVPIAAAGLGGAALAGLYEKNKANKEAKKAAIIDNEIHGGRGRRSRSRSRTYGADPIYPDDEAPGSYHRRHSRGHSRGSSGSSPDTRRRHSSRSRSRGKHVAEVAGIAGAAALGAHELGKRRERSRADKERRRQSDEYSDDYDRPSGYIDPRHSVAGYNTQTPAQSSYPGGNYFPPPPMAAQAEPAYHENAEAYPSARDSTAAAQNYSPYATYNPADYPPPGTHQPYEQTRGVYGDSDATLGAPHQGQDNFAGDSRYPGGEDAAAQREREHERREDAAAAEGQHRGRDRDPGNMV